MSRSDFYNRKILNSGSLSSLDVTGLATFRDDVTIEGNLTISNSASQTISFGDNDRLKLGDSNDLEIYHDGSNSFINETGTGSLIQQASAHFIRQGGTNNTNNAIMLLSGSVSLFHNNVSKLETTSTGIDVDGNIRFVNTGDYLKFANDFVAVKRASNFLRLDGFAGFIFNETNGAGELMRLNSTGLGIGTFNPSNKLQIESTNNNDGFRLNYPSNNSTQYPFFIGKSDDSVYFRVNSSNLAFKRNGGTSTIKTEGSSNDLTIQSQRHLIFNTSDANERVRILNNGRVGIGTQTANAALDIQGSAADLRLTSTGQSRTALANTSTGFEISQIGNKAIYFLTNGTEKARISGDGKVGIGTSSPDAILHVKDVNPRIIKLEDANYTDQYATIGFDDGHIKLSSDPDNQRANSIISFSIDNSLKMLLSSDGDLALGLTSASKRLHVFDTTSGIARFQTDQTFTDIELKTNNGTALVSARDGNVLLNRTGGNVGIATEPGAAYKLDVNGKVKARSVLELDDVLTLNAISTPSDPGTNQSSIYMDSADGAIRVKINVGGTTVTRTLATFE